MLKNNGSTWDCEFDKHGMMIEGIQITPDGETFEGTFGTDSLWLHGKHTYQSKEVVVGTCVYVGGFKNKERHGFGIITLPNGTTIEGTNEYGSPVGVAKTSYPDGTVREHNVVR